MADNDIDDEDEATATTSMLTDDSIISYVHYVCNNSMY